MASHSQPANSNLTTDAVPSPNRSTDDTAHKENNVSDDDPCDKTEDISDTIHANVEYCPSPGRAKHSINKVPPIAGTRTTIININNSKDIHVGDTINYSISNTVDTKLKNTVIETAAIQTLKSSNEPITRDDLFVVSAYIDESWKDVARSLDYTDSEIKQFYLDHHTYGIKEVVYQLLLDWKQNQPQKASVGLLAKILFDNNQGDALRKWSEKK